MSGEAVEDGTDRVRRGLTSTCSKVTLCSWGQGGTGLWCPFWLQRDILICGTLGNKNYCEKWPEGTHSENLWA